MTKSLFEITRERAEADAILVELAQLEEQSEYDIQRAEELMSRLDISEEDLENKAVAYVQIIHEIEAQNELAVKERKRLIERIQRNNRTIDSLSKRLVFALETFNIPKLQAGTYTISTRKSRSLEITDETGIPHEYANVKQEVTPDKQKIKQRLQDLQNRADQLSDEELEELERFLSFAKITESKNLSVR